MTESDVTISLHSNSGNKEDYEQEETIYNDSLFGSNSGSGSSSEDPIFIYEDHYEANESKEEKRDIMEEQTETSSYDAVSSFNEFEVMYKTQEIFNYYSKVNDEERKRFLLETVNDFGSFEGLNKLYNKVQTPFLEKQAFATSFTTNSQIDNQSYSINTNRDRQCSSVINIVLQGSEMKKCVSPSFSSYEEHALGNKQCVDVKDKINGSLLRLSNNFKFLNDGIKRYQPVKNFLKAYPIFLIVVDFQELLGNVTKVKEMVKTFELEEMNDMLCELLILATAKEEKPTKKLKKK